MKGVTLTITAFLFTFLSFAQSAQPILLYPDGVPNSKPAPVDYVEKNDKGWVTRVTVSSLTPFFPAKNQATKTAVIVIPGGGYAGIAINHEGIEIAKKFAAAGITAFVLKYRLPSDLIMTDRSIGPLQDAQRAIQVLRERASEWNLDTNKIGIIGFSAGGHLASTLGTHYQKALINNPSNISLRPSFMALIYPVITMEEYTHMGSKQNLIGQTAAQEQIKLYSNEKQVNSNTPTTFLLHAQDDAVVPVKNSLSFYEAITKSGGKAEMHLYQAGGHGFGLNNKTTPDQWFDRCINWLKANQLF
jgi:acetyl esterase/lipase